MKNLTLVLLFAIPTFLFSQNYSGPESVEGDTLTGNYYVGNTGSDKILRRLPDGTLEEFAAGISNGPYGLEIVDSVLYACNGGEVRGFSLTDGSQVFSVQTGGSFLNGITHDTDGFLYTTDFSGKRIYKIDIVGESSEVFVASTGSTPNGIIFDAANDRLVFVSWGGAAKIHAVALFDASLSTLVTTNFSNIDGVAMDNDGNFFVASWGADAVHKFEPTFTDAPELVASNLDRPADIFYNLKTDTLAIPNSGNNTVTFVGFESDPPSEAGEVLADFQLELFPNPASERLTVTSELENFMATARFQIFSQMGTQVDAPILELTEERLVIGLENLPTGQYLLRVIHEGRAGAKLFLKR